MARPARRIKHKQRTPEEYEAEVNAIMLKVRPLLMGHEPTIVASVLGTMMVMFICGFRPPEVRDSVFDEWIDRVRQGVTHFAEAQDQFPTLQ